MALLLGRRFCRLCFGNDCLCNLEGYVMKSRLMVGIVLALTTYAAAASDFYLLAGVNPLRGQSYNVAAGWTPLGNAQTRLGVEVEYASFGVQPEGFDNLNRAGNISVIGFSRLSEKVGVFAKLGFNNTYWSYNGTNDHDRSDDKLWGYLGGAGIEYVWRENVRFFAQAVVNQYKQVDKDAYGGYTHATLGVRYLF